MHHQFADHPAPHLLCPAYTALHAVSTDFVMQAASGHFYVCLVRVPLGYPAT